jgi:hypothetical protein
MPHVTSPRVRGPWPICHYLAAFSTLVISFSLGSLAHGDPPPVPRPLFEAIDAGELEASLVPRNSTRATIQFENKTDRPLTIQMPEAFAAAPILAQQPFGGPFGQMQGNNQNNNSPQQLGMGMGMGNNGMGFGNNGQGFGNNGLNQGIFNIPAGRVIRVRVDCVCLEYGKPDPDARFKYQLKPLSEVCDKPELVSVLKSLGHELVDQRVAQAATWHLTNELSWNQIAGLVKRKAGSVTEMQFQGHEVAAAQAYLDRLEKSQRAAADRSRVAASHKYSGSKQTAGHAPSP